MIETTAIAQVTAAPPAMYREPAPAAVPGQGAQFTAALDRALADPALADRYVRAESVQAALGSGDGAFNHLGKYATSMSHTFRNSIDESFAKLAHLDFTEPAAMITVMEVQLGVFSAASHVQFASKVADFSVHGLTTLFRNQG